MKGRFRHRPVTGERENHERWLISYADFITLLFAFFVVMYAVSSLNAGKYRVLAESLEKAFQNQPGQNEAKTAEPIQVGEPPKKLMPIETDARLGEEAVKLEQISNQLEEVLAPYIEEDLIEVKRTRFWVAVEMKSGMLFPSGSAQLDRAAEPVLVKLAEVMRQMPGNPIQVEGHTDNVPIRNRQFPSNWELSAARAASVVRRLIQYGVAPTRLAAVGYGEYHPVADNGSEAGRYRNRRVVVVLQAKNLARYPSAGQRFPPVPAGRE